MASLRGNRSFFLLLMVHLKLGPITVISRVFWSKSLKPVVVFIKTWGFLVDLEALPPAGPEGGAERFHCLFARFGPQAAWR